MTQPPSSDSSPLRHELLTAVDSIRDTLLAEIDGQEQNAELSRVSADALYDAGILRMKLPAVLGGHEADLVTQFEVIEALARISPAAAWCAMVGTTSLGLPGAFLPDAGAAKMFSAGRIPRGAVLIMPTGQATAVAGGYRLSGRWAFASGVQHAEWISAHALVRETPQGAPVLFMLVFPANDITLHDNWQVLGLRGTGSCDISVTDIFVPNELAWNVATQTPQRGGCLYELGIPAFVSYEHAAFALGLARSVLDELTGLAIEKRRGYGPGAPSLADRPALQRFIGHSDMRLRAARALTMTLNEQAMDVVASGAKPTTRLALELRSSAVYCTEVGTEIINQAFRYSGAAAIFEGQLMQRCLRDISVAAQHLMVSEIAYELLGKTHLGFEDVRPMG